MWLHRFSDETIIAVTVIAAAAVLLHTIDTMAALIIEMIIFAGLVGVMNYKRYS